MTNIQYNNWLSSEGSPVIDQGSINDLDISKRLENKPIVVTFYSHRGGVGRSTTLANCASVISDLGYRVICIDADLEAPSLDQIFDVKTNDTGFVDLLVEAEVDEISMEKVLSSIIKIGDNNLYLIPSGNLDVEYIKSLRWIDTDIWYETQESPFQKIIGLIKNTNIRPDFIFLDAKTGISDLNSPFLFIESDIVLTFFVPNEQSFRGNKILFNSITNSTNHRGLKTDIKYVVSMLPLNKVYASKLLDKSIDFIVNLEPSAQFSIEEKIQTISYNESIASNDSMENYSKSPYIGICEWLTALIPLRENSVSANITKLDKKEVIRDLIKYVEDNSVTTDVKKNSQEYFIKNSQYDEILDRRISLVVGRKGTGKTSLFLHFVEVFNAAVMSAPVGLLSSYPKAPSRKTYAEWRRKHGNSIDIWRKFWLLQILNCVSSDNIFEKFGDLDENVISDVFMTSSYDESMELLFAIDGLDDGFGSSKHDLETRAASIDGLLDFWYHYGNRMPGRSFKIFLRKDLWDRARVVNKSHFYGSMLNIKWSKDDYFSVLEKLSKRSEKFQDYYDRLLSQYKRQTPNLTGPIDPLTFLLNPRMEGVNSAYTINWIWNRLGDANKEHNVRILIALYKESLERSLLDENDSVNIISPQALINSMPAVSDQALDSIREEYEIELKGLIEEIVKIKITPFERKRLKSTDEAIKFAQEIGLLDVRIDGRIAVPDLYRYSLDVSRKGRQ